MRAPNRTLPPRSFVGAAALVICLAAGTPAAAQEMPLVSKWEFTIGSYFTNVDTSIRADASRLDLGTDIDLEDAVGFDDTENLLRFTARRRIKRRHIVGFAFTELSRSSTRDIPFEIEFRDLVFPANISVDSEFDMRLFDFRYAYLPVLKEKTAVAVVGGVGRWDYDFRLTARADRIGQSLDGNVDVDEIVPLLGGAVRHLITRKLQLDAQLLALTFDLGDTSGTIVEAGLGGRYWFHDNVGLALSFDFLNADVSFDDDRFIGDVEYELTGIQVFIPIRID